MKISVVMGLALAAVTVTACGKAQDSGEGQSEATAEASAGAPPEVAMVAPDGAKLFAQCRACHSLKKGEPNRLGPNLHAMFGATAGKKEGFTYSAALKASTIVWTPETVGAWLEKPRDYIPGNKMVYGGMAKPEDRAALIEYLQKETK
jgi:cytochrome c